MLFSDQFIEELIADPIRGVPNLIGFVRASFGKGASWAKGDRDICHETYALLCELFDAGLLQCPAPDFPLTGDIDSDCSKVSGYLTELEEIYAEKVSQAQITSFKNRFKAVLGNTFAYEFSQGDLERVQALINELRSAVQDIKSLDDNHRARLLRRLERLQAEMHKKVSDLDRFWGLIGDAGVALGKLGKESKPIVDRIREISQIVWQTQARAEELPSGTSLPRLEGDGKENSTSA